MYTYNSKTGELAQNGSYISTGYSGTGAGRNNPEMENVSNVGPIPRGKYKIGPEYVHPHEGPCVMNLTPEAGTDTHGRSAFHIHGNNTKNDASHGCIILGPTIRHIIATDDDKEIEVF